MCGDAAALGLSAERLPSVTCEVGDPRVPYLRTKEQDSETSTPQFAHSYPIRRKSALVVDDPPENAQWVEG